MHEDQEVQLYNEICKYLKHGEYRVGMLVNWKSGRFAGEHTVSCMMKEGLLYLKSNTADMTERQWIVNK